MEKSGAEQLYYLYAPFFLEYGKGVSLLGGSAIQFRTTIMRCINGHRNHDIAVVCTPLRPTQLSAGQTNLLKRKGKKYFQKAIYCQLNRRQAIAYENIGIFRLNSRWKTSPSIARDGGCSHFRASDGQSARKNYIIPTHYPICHPHREIRSATSYHIRHQCR